MRFRAKRWAVFTLSASAALLLLCALAWTLLQALCMVTRLRPRRGAPLRLRPKGGVKGSP